MLRAFGISKGKNQVTAPAGPGQPIRLVAYDQDGKFYIPPEATAALRRIKGPLAVVSICGRARQGKSFILNQVGSVCTDTMTYVHTLTNIREYQIMTRD